MLFFFEFDIYSKYTFYGLFSWIHFSFNIGFTPIDWCINLRKAISISIFFYIIPVNRENGTFDVWTIVPITFLCNHTWESRFGWCKERNKCILSQNFCVQMFGFVFSYYLITNRDIHNRNSEQVVSIYLMSAIWMIFFYASWGGWENRCNCHVDTKTLQFTKITVLFSISTAYLQLTTLQAHTMAPMNLFCTRFLKSLLVKDDSTSSRSSSSSRTTKSQEPQSDDDDNDDDDEQMHSDWVQL